MALHPDVIDYIESIDEDKKEAITRLANIIEENLPEGFASCKM